MAGLLLGPRRALLGKGGIAWLLNDSFNDTLAAGSVNGTLCTPGPGTRTVVDGGNKLSLSGGDLVMERDANYDPGLWIDSVVREAGRLMVGHVNLSNAFNRIQIGWDGDQAGQATECFKSVLIEVRIFNTVIQALNLVAARDYYFSVVLKAAGAYFFVKESTALPNWTLLFMNTVISTTPLYPVSAVSNGWNSGTNAHKFLRVPLNLWLPTPFMYHTFTAGNGTSLDAASSDIIGPDGQPTPSLDAVEQSGNWDIQSNRANPDGAGIATWDVGGADVLIDCVINGGAAGNPGIVLRFTDTSNYWYLQADRATNQLEIHEVNATVDTVRATKGVVINDSTDYNLKVISQGTTIWGFINESDMIKYLSASLNEGATKHGLFSDNTVCQFDNLLMFARNGGYYDLDSYL